jgi:hypothetical protein
MLYNLSNKVLTDIFLKHEMNLDFSSINNMSNIQFIVQTKL